MEEMKTLKKEHEYAGFYYRIVKSQGLIQAVPFSGQHYAAWKDKHVRAAIEDYTQGLK